MTLEDYTMMFLGKNKIIEGEVVYFESYTDEDEILSFGIARVNSIESRDDGSYRVKVHTLEETLCHQMHKEYRLIIGDGLYIDSLTPLPGLRSSDFLS